MKDRVCLTPGSIYTFTVKSKERKVGVEVVLPDTIVNFPDTAKEAEALENELHDAVEAVLAKYFKKPKATFKW